MHITFFSKDTKPEPWVNALRLQLPEARVEAWAPGADPADYAVVWAPPQDGVVDEVLYAPGDQVTEGAELLRLGMGAA